MKRIVLLSVSSLILFPVPAFAYLDAGTGSYVLQIVLAMVIGGLYSLKLYWQKIKAYFQKLTSKDDKPS